MLYRVAKIVMAIIMIVTGIVMILNGSLDPERGRYIIGAVIAIAVYKAMGKFTVNGNNTVKAQA